MAKADVFFTDMRTSMRKNILQKLDDLVDAAGLENIVRRGDFTAVKVHFGEEGNTSFIRPIFVRRIVEAIKELGGLPFLTDTNTLYVGERGNAVSHLGTAIRHGFAYAVVDAPVIIADGLRGSSAIAKTINGTHYQSVQIAEAIANADSIVALSHFKGHELSGFGGAIKNLGMGCATRAGKLSMHSNISPKVKVKFCTGCADCVKACAHGAITITEKKARIDPEKCAGCGECISACPQKTILIQWTEGPQMMQEKMSEYAYGALTGKEEKSFFVNFLTQISPSCDCMSNDTPVVPDIGILASTDPVAIDQASVDLVNNAQGLTSCALKEGHAPGEDKFMGVHPKADWRIQLAHAQKTGLGNRSYELTELTLEKR